MVSSKLYYTEDWNYLAKPLASPLSIFGITLIRTVDIGKSAEANQLFISYGYLSLGTKIQQKGKF